MKPAFFVFFVLASLIPAQAVAASDQERPAREQAESQVLEILRSGLAEVNRQNTPDAHRTALARLLARAAAGVAEPIQAEIAALAAKVNSAESGFEYGLTSREKGVLPTLFFVPGESARDYAGFFVVRIDQAASRRSEKMFRALRGLEIKNVSASVPTRIYGGGDLFRVADFVMAAPEQSRFKVHNALVLPRFGADESEGFFQVILLRNLEQIRFQDQVLPLWKKLLGRDQKMESGFSAYLDNLLLHRQAHALGPVFTSRRQETPETVDQALKELAAPAEELKAWAVAAAAGPEMERLGLLENVSAGHLEAALIAALLADLHPTAGPAARAAAVAGLQFMLEQGLLLYDLSRGRLVRSEALMAPAMLELAESLAQFQVSGNYSGLLRFLGPLQEPGPELLEIERQVLSCLEQAGAGINSARAD